MLHELGWSSVHVEWLREKLGEEGERWATAYERERAVLLRTAATAHGMGIEDRKIALAEAYGAQIMLLIAQVSQDPEIPMNARPILRRVFARELRALDGGGDA